MDQSRRAAFDALARIEDGAYSNIALNLKGSDPDINIPFVRELVYGVIETKYYLDYYIDRLAKSGISSIKKKPLILIRMGIYQIAKMDSVPDFAACNEMVDLSRSVCPGSSGFVNAILRNYIRKRDDIEPPESIPDPVTRLATCYSVEGWIVDLWIHAYGIDKTESMLSASIGEPPLYVKANTLKSGTMENDHETSGVCTDRIIECLRAEGIKAERVHGFDDVLSVRGENVLSSGLFKDGAFFVQDLSSDIALRALSPVPGETLVDVCAAPGGKSFLAAMMMSDNGKIYSFDIYDKKIEMLRREQKRLDISAIEADICDALMPRADLIGKADKVICDVPCSGLGVIRRKPEIKYKKIKDCGKDLAKKQYAILEASSTYLKPGGSLMYSTCTVNPIENDDVTSRFTREHKGFAVMKEEQLFIGERGTDGFYYCIIKKEIS